MSNNEIIRKGRLEEEFEIESEVEAFKDYAYISSILSANYNLIADELSKLGDFQTGLALDIGTGLGDLAIEIAKRYPQLKVIGIDISQRAIEEATKKAKHENLGNVTFRLQDVHNFSFQDGSVDLVASHGAVHHFKDLNRAFSEIYRILKPNGLAYITDLRRDAPKDVVKEVEDNLPSSQGKAFLNSVDAAYTPEELREILVKLKINNFNISGQRFSRDTIMKNKDKLRKSSMRGLDYTKLSQVIIIRKEV